jgi:uncharacterized RDD family membrane protein YckC
MRPRFEPDSETGEIQTPPAVLIDPEAFDASEQEFAASLEVVKGRFVVEPVEGVGGGASTVHPAETPEACAPDPVRPASFANADMAPEPDSESWRKEVSDRLGHYRARRRPRAPRYPSLRLKFDDGEPARNAPRAEPHAPATRQSVAVDSLRADPAEEEFALPDPAYSQPASVGLGTGPRIIESTNAESITAETKPVESRHSENKIIEFPRSAAMPVPLEELAEPVFDRPRILEAPDVAPPVPALGGILIEPVEEAPLEKRPGFEVPLQSAPMALRLAATAIDAVIVIVALAMFAYLFFRITASVPPLLPAASMTVVVLGILWTIYQYLLLIGSGTTPGLKLARLQLNRFDGSPVPRTLRRWRVLTSVISGVSLGLGYAWCFFDEDQLCWHDRITRTYMAPQR